MSTLNLPKFNMSIENLRKTIENYMKDVVDGDDFKDSLEQGFEDAVRNLLKSKGFYIVDKKNVKNIIAIAEAKGFSKIDREIPDGGIICSDGLVLIEIKYCNKETAYQADREKVSGYLTHEKCEAAGVLFLDKKQYPKWQVCNKNPMYFYEWKFVNISK